jgi:hypothetical protein
VREKMKYQVWQTLKGAVRAAYSAREKFRASQDYNAGTLVGFEIRRADGGVLTKSESDAIAYGWTLAVYESFKRWDGTGRG